MFLPRPGHVLLLPQSLRPLLARRPPRALLARGAAGLAALRGRLVVSVGDHVTRLLLSAGVEPWAAVFDCAEHRSPSECPSLPGYQLLSARNPRSTITWEAVEALRAAIREGRAALRVEGEEDLLALPAALLAPQGSYIVYGLPAQGAAVARVDRCYKLFVERLLSLFPEEPVGELEGK